MVKHTKTVRQQQRLKCYNSMGIPMRNISNFMMYFMHLLVSKPEFLRTINYKRF